MNFRGSHDQAQNQAEACEPLNRPKDCQAHVTQAIGACIVQISRGTRYQARPHYLNATDAYGCNDRSDHDCYGLATVMIAAIVAPVGIRSIAIMRACLVSGPAADLDDAGADRLRDAGLAVFRAVERFAAFGLVLGLVMGSSEVHAAPSAAPPQPRPGNFTRQGRTLKRP